MPTLVHWKWRDTGAEFDVELDDDEYEWFKGVRDAVVVMEPCDERTVKLNEVCTFMELKVALDARTIPPAEAVERGLVSDEEPGAGKTEVLAQMESMESRGFRFPEKVKEQMAAGQTSLLSEPAPASHPEVRLPYKDEEREPLEEPQAASEPAPASPVGMPGVYGGRVPAFTVEEAAEAFQTWKADEFGWLKTRVILLALDRGEYHSEMLVGVPLTNRNLIGAVTNTLGAAGLMEPLNRRGDAETRISSSTSRRKSNVWRLTITGQAMAEDLAATPEIAAWVFPERSGT